MVADLIFCAKEGRFTGGGLGNYNLVDMLSVTVYADSHKCCEIKKWKKDVI